MEAARGANKEERVVELPVDRIAPNPLQPRRRFDTDQILKLAQSIRSQGVIQPIIVRPHPRVAGEYELVAGERRLRAIRHLGRTAAPALVRKISDRDLLEAALVENLQREQLSPIEEAQAYRELMRRFGYTQENVAQRVGKERSTVANMVRLLGLPHPIQQDLETGRLSVGHARALLPIGNPARQIAIRDAVISGGLSVRDTENLVKSEVIGSGGEAAGSDRPNQARLDPQFQAVQDALERRYGTRVTIRQKQHQGRVELEFYSLDDFNRIYDLLVGRESSTD